jgi:twitching motility protein PilT
MRRNELDHILGAMLESQKEVSDLNITVDKPLQVETNGQLVAAALSPSIDKLTPFQSEMMALNLIGGNRRLNGRPAAERFLRLLLCAGRQGQVPRKYILPTR